ncbi:MAG TPA: hypothetical protein PLC48_00020 [Ferruginibacter sp.]|nr:hypothetical protein [Ferruginibacter sp.]
MRFSSETLHPLQEKKLTVKKEISKGFKGFVQLLMGQRSYNNQETLLHRSANRNDFLQKYQQLLLCGKMTHVKVEKLIRMHKEKSDKNTILRISFRLPADKEDKLVTASAMTTPERMPVKNSVIQIFYNPFDLSVIVLL